jgi:hypothetical protein
LNFGEFAQRIEAKWHDMTHYARERLVMEAVMTS